MSVVNNDRKLARVVIIDSLHPIEGADRIELAMVGGWQVVAQKGLYTTGCKAVYFEVDSLLPLSAEAFAFLSSSKNVTVEGEEYTRIKTIKLRKQLSQGILMPMKEMGASESAPVDYDLTKKLGILKYESPDEKQLAQKNVRLGTSALGFPKFVRKTDQTRVQNIVIQYQQACDKDELFEKSFKLDGSSLSAFVKDNVPGVASRNVGFRVEEEKIPLMKAIKAFFAGKGWKRVIKADDNSFTQMTATASLIEAIKQDGRNLAIQGEMVGPAIQKNFEGVTENEFYCYDIFLIDEQQYMLPQERQDFCKLHNIKHVPIAGTNVRLLTTVAEAIKDADGPSGLNGKYREGFVYKSMTRDFSFKVISNAYLLKEE